MGFQVVSYWAGELLDLRTFDSRETAQVCADTLNKELSIDAVVRPYDEDRPRNWISSNKTLDKIAGGANLISERRPANKRSKRFWGRTGIDWLRRSREACRSAKPR